ncbi:DUF4241 domain-containing protein [Oceanicola sp. 502str15]|uniref:DUF4241 domain-containing protein n=1 Tax=Oceanicola sp. 502str15 TaxID=2696061 RepID=UPI002094A0B1|nr:DUF4241 domain-containing protein [Oceanicola sp. 502str15]MCO6382139.1 hypothetical protein [Oceanicola sp. 502str15]
MLKSQRHYYWIGGGIWAALMLGGGIFVVVTSLRGDGTALSDALDIETFEQAAIVTEPPGPQNVLVTEAGEVDIGPSGLTLTDPVAEPDRPPFDIDVPEGRYQTLIYRHEDDPRVIGMVALRLSDAPVTFWERPGRKSHPLDFEFGVDELVALGDAEAVAALDADAVKAALEQGTGPVPYATIRSEGRDVLLFDPSFETFSADTYAGYDADGNLAILVKDYGYFGSRAALEKPTEERP